MDSELSMEQMIHTLLQEPHVVRIEQEERFTSFPEIDLNSWPDENRENIGRTIHILQEMLPFPYFVDDFEVHHRDRVQWIRQYLEPKYPWYNENFYQKDSLRMGAYIVPLHMMTTHLCYYQDYRGTNPDEYNMRFDKYIEIFQRTNCYDHELSTVEKLAVVKDLKLAVYDILIFLSEQKPIAAP